MKIVCLMLVFSAIFYYLQVMWVAWLFLGMAAGVLVLELVIVGAAIHDKIFNEETK